MATLTEIKNLVECGAGGVIGTGVKGCRPALKKVSSIFLLPSGFRLDPDAELNEEYFKTLQMEGNLIVLKGIRAFTDNSEENVTETLEDGTTNLLRLGLYQFNANFINGLHFNKALNALSGFGNYDAIFVDGDGNMLGTEALGGSMKGFTIGYMQADKLTWATDSAGMREGITFQLLDRSEVDTDFLFIQGTQLDFNPNRLDGVNEIRTSFATTPVVGATTLDVKAVTGQDGKPFRGAEAEDFLVQVNGATEEGVTVAEVNGVYTFSGVTALALNDEVTVQLYDNANNRGVIELDVDLYKSNVARTVVVSA